MAKVLVKKSMKNKQNIIGWYGVLAILAAYVLLNLKVVDASSLGYQLLNFTGAGGIIYEAGSKRDVQPVALNVIWALVALLAIIRIVVS